MKTGMDYKGQSLLVWREIGKQVGYNVSIDIAKIAALASGGTFPGFLCIEVGGETKGSWGNHRMMMLQYQAPDPFKSFDRQRNMYPICLANMSGSFRGIKIGISVEVGVKTPDLKYNVLEDVDLGPVNTDILSFGLEAKATVGAAASYSGLFYTASDPAPRWFQKEKRNVLKEHVIPALKDGGRRHADLLGIEIQIYNKYHENALKAIREEGIEDFQKKNLGGMRGFRFPPVVTKQMLEPEIKERFLRKKKVEYQFNKQSYVMFSSHLPEAELGVKAEAKVNLGPISPKVDIQGPKVSGSIKCENYRIQNGCFNGAIMTQDTRVTYKKVGLQILKIEAGIDLNILPSFGDDQGTKDDDWDDVTYVGDYEGEVGVVSDLQNKISQGVQGKVARGIDKVDRLHVRQTVAQGVDKVRQLKQTIDEKLNIENCTMSYHSAIAVWGNDPLVGKIQIHKGSGYVTGHSAGVKSMKLYYRVGESAPDSRYGKFFGPAARMWEYTLACSLGVELDDLRLFLKECSGIFMAVLFDPGFKAEALIIEATFGVDEQMIDMETATVGKKLLKRGSGTKVPITDYIPDLTKMFRKSLKTPRTNPKKIGRIKIGKKVYKNLQSIRLRFRMADNKDEETMKFKLGFKLFGTGMGITLEGLDRGASEAIVDLHTQWFGKDVQSTNAMNATGKSKGVYNRPETVVPTVLL